jgi:alkylation response protein AidB-like acyl-CoA dehydrogenase
MLSYSRQRADDQRLLRRIAIQGDLAGMDFSFSSEQLALREAVLHFARQEIGKKAFEHDQEETFDADGWRACAEFGVLGWPVPAEYGGAGYDPLTTIIACEALGYGCRDNGLVFAVENHLWACVVYILRHGSTEQKQRFLPQLANGSAIGALALTEPESGSDVLSLRTKAERSNGNYILSGTKCFISNGPNADLYVVFARTHGAAMGQSHLSAFLVPRPTPGLSVRRTMSKAGLRGTLMAEIELDGCIVPAHNRLGAEGAGYQVFTSTVEWERGFMAASQIGRAQRILDGCARWARERVQFGRPIVSYQAVSHRLADMKMRIELAKLMLYKIGWLKGHGQMAALESSIIKVFASESLLQTALDAVRLHGARGYVTDMPVERELRDAFGCSIFGGTSDIHRNVIANLSGIPGL